MRHGIRSLGTARPRKTLRGDIQALRALAVLMVVGVHLWPSRLKGGFVGVDIFFVISGFLITSHLLRELDATGSISLGRFYARRVRRLLPAAYLVILVSAAGVVLLMPWDLWGRNFTELAASVGYVQNLWLTAQSVDYHAQGQAATVAQHYWSLSVEEQFYLVWPAVLLALRHLFGRRRYVQGGGDVMRARFRRFLALGSVVIVLVSFGFSLWFTGFSPRQAYFFTPVRFWEFMTGGCLAVLSPWISRVLGGAGALVLAVAAWAGLVVSGFVVDPAKPFPGWWAVLPVVSTASVIAAGCPGAVPGLRLLTDLRAVRLLGDASYSMYLWHWPFIILLPHLLGRAVLLPEKLVILVATTFLAVLTKRWVEEPGQRVNWGVRRTFAVTAGAMSVVLALCAGSVVWAHRSIASAAAVQRDFLDQECSGPAALLRTECRDHVNDPLVSTVLGQDAEYFREIPGCVWLSDAQDNGMPSVYECDYTPAGQKPYTVMLIGDSHAQQWEGTLNAVAKRNGWRMRLSLKGGCPITHLPLSIGDPKAEAECSRSQAAVDEYVLAQAPDVVVYSTYAIGEHVDDGTGRSQGEMYSDALGATWSRWAANGTRVVVVADTPLNDAVRPAECVTANASNPEVCARPRSEALPDSPMSTAVRALGDPRVTLVDLTDAFCDETRCYAAVGGLQVYYDYNHVQRAYAMKLVDQLDAGIKRQT